MRDSFARRVVGFISLLTITLFFAVTVSGYTLVMRGGRRIEIPARFVVTGSTLTYEVSPGIQVTLALAAIDVPGTEKANSEQPGSLLARNQVESPRSHGQRQRTRTITNRDLEPTTRRRQESEAVYERKRKLLGLPTLDETRRRTAAVPDFSGTDLERQLIADRESETYWRARASALRSEMSALDSELSYLRARLEEFQPASFSSYSVVSGGFPPFISFGNVAPFSRLPVRRHNGGFAARQAGAQLHARIGFGGGATRSGVFVNSGDVSLRRGFGGRGHLQFPVVAPFGVIGQPYDYSLERSALIMQFNERAATRAGLNARWRELENEARRAGASPGWLRP